MQTTPRRWLLRERTADAHAAVDAAVGGFTDLAGYQSYLIALAGFRGPIERQLGELAWPATLGDWRPTGVSSAIARDLADFGLSADEPHGVPLSMAGDRLYGTLYVLEGSALGAQLLYRRAQELGLTEDFGARHLALLSGGVAGWRGFLDRLEQAEPFDLDSAVDASVAAFALARDAFGATRG